MPSIDRGEAPGVASLTSLGDDLLIVARPAETAPGSTETVPADAGENEGDA